MGGGLGGWRKGEGWRGYSVSVFGSVRGGEGRGLGEGRCVLRYKATVFIRTAFTGSGGSCARLSEGINTVTLHRNRVQMEARKS